jgi:putative DNA-invertase from lambdoid prophage Rac
LTHLRHPQPKGVQRAGIEHAKANGDSYRGRKPSYSRDQLQIVRDILGQQAGIGQIAKTTGLTRQTTYRIQGDRAGSERLW